MLRNQVKKVPVDDTLDADMTSLYRSTVARFELLGRRQAGTFGTL